MFILKNIIISLIMALFLIGWAQAEEYYSDQKVCNAIWYVEGQEKANQAYGINPQYVKCENRLECYDVCIRTVAKWRKVYNFKKENADFLTFLSYKYCPPNHLIWLKNLKFYLRKLK